MNNISGIAHVALYTSKFEESIEFYEKAFGAISLGVFMTSRRGCWLQMGDSVLEIFESEDFPPQGSFKHFAIQCNNVEEAYAKALEAGGNELVQPKEVALNMIEPKRLKIAFVTGVNGEEIELCETLL